MDLNMLKYQQQNFVNDKSEELISPYAKEEAFFEQHFPIFDFESLNENLKDLGADTIFTLKNGNQVHIVKTQKAILITVGHKGGSKFTGSWTIINDYEEYGKVLGELEDTINK